MSNEMNTMMEETEKTDGLFTPEFLDEASSHVEVEHGFLLEYSQGYGCGGVSEVYHVFLAKASVGDTLSMKKARVVSQRVQWDSERELASAKKEREATLPSAPVWDGEWKGTRKEFDEAHAAWRQGVSPVPEVTRSEALETAWRREGGEVLTVQYPVHAVNSGEARETVSVDALVFHEEHGCRCSGSGGSRWGLLDESDEGEEPGERYPAEMFLAPRVTLVTVASGKRFVVNKWRDRGEAETLLREYAESWKAVERERASEREGLEAQLSLFASKEDLAGMSYAEFEARRDEPNKRWGLERKLASLGETGDGLDKVRSVLRLTLPGLRETDDSGWLSDGKTIGRGWRGAGGEGEGEEDE